MMKTASATASIFPMGEKTRELFGSREAFSYSFMKILEGVSGIMPVTYDPCDANEFTHKAIAYCRYLIMSKAVTVSDNVLDILNRLEEESLETGDVSWLKDVKMKVF